MTLQAWLKIPGITSSPPCGHSQSLTSGRQRLTKQALHALSHAPSSLRQHTDDESHVRPSHRVRQLSGPPDRHAAAACAHAPKRQPGAHTPTHHPSQEARASLQRPSAHAPRAMTHVPCPLRRQASTCHTRQARPPAPPAQPPPGMRIPGMGMWTAYGPATRAGAVQASLPLNLNADASCSPAASQLAARAGVCQYSTECWLRPCRTGAAVCCLSPTPQPLLLQQQLREVTTHRRATRMTSANRRPRGGRRHGRTRPRSPAAPCLPWALRSSFTQSHAHMA